LASAITPGLKEPPVVCVPCHQVKNVLLIKDSTSSGFARARDWSGALELVTSRSAQPDRANTATNAKLVIFFMILGHRGQLVKFVRMDIEVADLILNGKE